MLRVELVGNLVCRSNLAALCVQVRNISGFYTTVFKTMLEQAIQPCFHNRDLSHLHLNNGIFNPRSRSDCLGSYTAVEAQQGGKFDREITAGDRRPGAADEETLRTAEVVSPPGSLPCPLFTAGVPFGCLCSALDETELVFAAMTLLDWPRPRRGALGLRRRFYQQHR